MKIQVHTEEDFKKMNKGELIQNNLVLQKTILTLTKNSQTSSIPPTQDTIKNQEKNKFRTKSLREKSDKKNGGQEGHEGRTRRKAKPNRIIQHKPETCPDCKKAYGKKTKRSIIGSRQLVDIPEIKLDIEEHQVLEATCKCGCITKGNFPKQINAPVKFGNTMKAHAVYMNVLQKIPYKRLTDIYSEVFGFTVSQGTIKNILDYMSEKIDPYYEEIVDAIKCSKRVGTDETGNHMNGEKLRIRTRQNDDFVYFVPNKSRGYKVVKEFFGEDFKGILVHDCWAAHNKTPAKAHQLCIIHLHRDLNFIIETENSIWAYNMKKLLLKAQRAQKRLKESENLIQYQDSILQYYKTRFDKLLGIELQAKEELKLQKRFKKHKDKIFVFLKYLYVPSHNNQSEQAIRNQKLHKKISGGFRSMNGAENHCKILSVIETLRKQGREIFVELKNIFDGNFSW